MVVIDPRTINFGQLKQGQRGVVNVTIRERNRRPSVNGQIKSQVAWLTVDRSSFSGPSTVVKATADTAQINSTGKRLCQSPIHHGYTAYLYTCNRWQDRACAARNHTPTEQRILRCICGTNYIQMAAIKVCFTYTVATCQSRVLWRIGAGNNPDADNAEVPVITLGAVETGIYGDAAADAGAAVAGDTSRACWALSSGTAARAGRGVSRRRLLER